MGSARPIRARRWAKHAASLQARRGLTFGSRSCSETLSLDASIEFF